MEVLSEFVAGFADRDAVLGDVAAVRHIVAICDVVGIKDGQVFGCAMEAEVFVATLTILAWFAAHGAAVAITLKN